MPSTVLVPAQSSPINNPMHQFASWTYTTTLWYLSINDYNALMALNTVQDALSWTPTLANGQLNGQASYVIAEDSGLYPTQRFPNVPYNYNIDDVEFTTQIAPSRDARASNVIEGKIKIIEPLGATFIDTIVLNNQILNEGNQSNYLLQPYMLEINFVGYDDNGNALPPSQTALYRKRFPITLTNINIEIDHRGARYELLFSPTSHGGATGAFSVESITVPTNLNITAGTVDEFFNGTNGLAAQLNAYYVQLASAPAPANPVINLPDTYAFKLDQAIATSTIVTQSTATATQSDPNSVTFDPSKKSFSIRSGTNILNIIDKIIAQSSYLTAQVNNASTGANQQAPMNFHKVTATSVYGQGGNYLDVRTQKYPKSITLNISQYVALDNRGANAPLATDATPYIIKTYNYLYTGENLDVINFKLNFDTTYYTATMALTSSDAAVNPGPNAAVDATLQGVVNQTASMGDVISSAQNPINLMPLRQRLIVRNQHISHGMGIDSNPDALKSAHVMETFFTSAGGDMVSLDMTIVGDPTMLKQDDWLYNVDPSASNDYTQSDQVNQNDFSKKYGHIRTDNGDVIVTVYINSPDDFDLDITNAGLYYPPPSTPYRSLFSGQYRIIQIGNKFERGQFTQTLGLSRIPNQDIAIAFGSTASNTRPSSTSTSSTSSSTTSSTVGGSGSASTSQSNQTNARN